MQPRNIYSAISGTLKGEEEDFEALLEQGNLRIERIISKGHRSPASGWYDQEKSEWVLLLKGSAELTFADNTSVRLNEGDYLLIPSHLKHKVSWTDPEQTSYWLAVHF